MRIMSAWDVGDITECTYSSYAVRQEIKLITTHAVLRNPIYSSEHLFVVRSVNKSLSLLVNNPEVMCSI